MLQKTFRTPLLVPIALLLALTSTARAADPPADGNPEAARIHTGAATEGIKHDAKVVGAAVKDGAQKVGVAAKQVGVAAKEVALQVADAAQEGAHQVAAAAKSGAAKTKAAVSGDKKPQTQPKE